MANPVSKTKNLKGNNKEKPSKNPEILCDLPPNGKFVFEEEVITGEAAQKFYALLMNPPKDSKKEERIKRAIKRFPNPDEPTELDIEL